MKVSVQTAVFLYMTFVVEFRLGGSAVHAHRKEKQRKKPGKKNTSVSNRLRARPVRKCPERKEEEAWLLGKPLPQMLPDQVERTGGRGRRGRS